MRTRGWSDNASSTDGDDLSDWLESLYVLRIGDSLVEIGSCAYPTERLEHLRETCSMPVSMARIWHEAGFMLDGVVEHFSNVQAPFDCDYWYFYTHSSVVVGYVDDALTTTGNFDLCADWRSWPNL